MGTADMVVALCVLTFPRIRKTGLFEASVGLDISQDFRKVEFHLSLQDNYSTDKIKFSGIS